MLAGQVFKKHHLCLPEFVFLLSGGPRPWSPVSVPLAPKFQKPHPPSLSQSSPHPQGTLLGGGSCYSGGEGTLLLAGGKGRNTAAPGGTVASILTWLMPSTVNTLLIWQWKELSYEVVEWLALFKVTLKRKQQWLDFKILSVILFWG